MKLEDQVCSLGQGKRLKDMGVVQGTYWIWREEKSYPENIPVLISAGQLPTGIDVTAFNLYSAFTVAELFVMLPDYYISWRFPYGTEKSEKWVTTVICSPKPNGLDDIHTASEFDRYADTQAQSLAILLIALLETNTITPEEVNQRLTN